MFGIGDKILAIVAAVLAVIFLLCAVVQTVRINGVSVFGLYAINGYKPMWEKDEQDLVTLRDNQKALSAGLLTCSTSVSAMHDIGVKLTDAAQKLVDAANTNAQQLQNNVAAIKAIKSSGEKCPVAESILMRAFQ
jgi:hypothetical protein